MLAYGQDFSLAARECIVSEAFCSFRLFKSDPIAWADPEVRVQEDAYIAMAGGGQMDLKFLDKLRDVAYLFQNPLRIPTAMISHSLC